MSLFKKSDDKQHLATIEDFRQKLASGHMPSHVQQIAERELELLSKTNPAAAEYTIGLTVQLYINCSP